jgi:D-alanyl-D-alanine carboxypeptidase
LSTSLVRRLPLAIAAAVVLAACSGTVSAPPTPVPSATFPPATVEAINTAIAKWFAEYKAPGVVVGIWIPGRGTYVAARGKADVKTGEPMRIDDHFRIGSITKTFTVTVLLQLVQQKRLSLDDPVSKYVSYIPNGRNITLRMLANMTAGLHSYTQTDEFVRELHADPYSTWTPRELLDIAIKHPPDFAPGTGWHYSNTNTVLLGVIIEKVTGEQIADVFKTYSFQPLDLTNTSWPASSALPAPYAHGITDQTANGKIVDATRWNPSWAFTAGQLISTLADLEVWVQAYTTGQQISPALQKQRLTWVTLPPNMPKLKYGLGIGYNHGWLGHEGSIPGYNTTAQYLPSLKATIVLEINSDIARDGVSPAAALMRTLAEILTPGNVPVLKPG